MRIHSYTKLIEADIVDAFCLLQKGFTDQFVYYDKQSPCRYMGLGRCVALPSLEDVQNKLEGPVDQPPVYFSFNRFDMLNREMKKGELFINNSPFFKANWYWYPSCK